jgi:hypothetical protein
MRALAVALSLLASPALAQTEAPATPAPAKVKVPEKQEEPAAEAPRGDSSEDNRVGKHADIGVERGLGLLFPATGFDATYFVTPDLLAGINYIQSSIDFSSVAKIKMSLVTVKAMYFFGNSFYATAGLGQRKIDFTFTLDAASASSGLATGKLKADASVANFGLDFGLGNRWQWSGFWLGVEWGGYFAPLAKSGDSKINVPGAEAKDVKDAQDSLDKLGKTGNPELLRLQLGWAF